MNPSSSVVLDASAIVEALLSPDVGAQLRAAIDGELAIAPEVVDFEVLSALRRLESRGEVDERRAGVAIADHLSFPLERVPHRAFLAGAWAMRHNLTPADALYVAVAQAFAATLITCDARLAGAPGLGVAVTVLPS